MRPLTVFGIVTSAIWVGAFCFIAFLNQSNAQNMGLNEWGDFLAGASAPLALLWLVIGYFQQGEELRLNTEALKAQQDELARQVEETKQLAASSERQAEASEILALLSKTEQEQKSLREKLDAQPIFLPQGGSTTGDKATTKIINKGGDAYDLEVDSSFELQFTFGASVRFQHNQAADLVIRAHRHELEKMLPYKIKISYTDKFDSRNTKELEFTGIHQFRERYLSRVSTASG